MGMSMYPHIGSPSEPHPILLVHTYYPITHSAVYLSLQDYRHLTVH
jgi:hypothetical protein